MLLNSFYLYIKLFITRICLLYTSSTLDFKFPRDSRDTILQHLKKNHYNYRALAFSGVRSFSGIATGGSRVCSVVACTGDTIDTCGKRFRNYIENATAIFEELSINAEKPTREMDLQADDSIFIPLSVNVNIMPLKSTDFNYNKVDNGNTTTHSYILINKNVELYTFGLWGRVFATDGLDADPPRNETEDASPDSSVFHLLNCVLLIPAILLLLRR